MRPAACAHAKCVDTRRAVIELLRSAFLHAIGAGGNVAGIRGLDAGQEYDFVLSLAEAAGLQTSACSILSVHVDSADKRTDVTFEVLVQDAQAADDCARTIGEIVVDGRLASALLARGLPRAVVRSQPRAYSAGLPLPMNVAGESAFTGPCIASGTKRCPPQSSMGPFLPCELLHVRTFSTSQHGHRA